MTSKRLQIKKREDAGYRPPQADTLTAIATQEEKVRLNVEIPKSTRQALKAKAAMEGLTIQQIIGRLVDEYLSK